MHYTGIYIYIYYFIHIDTYTETHTRPHRASAHYGITCVLIVLVVSIIIFKNIINNYYVKTDYP